MKKKIILICSFIFIIMSILFTVSPINAEEINEDVEINEDIEINNTEIDDIKKNFNDLLKEINELKSEEDNWFSKEIMKRIIDLVLEIGGVIIFIILYLKKNNLLINKNTQINADSQKVLNELKDIITKECSNLGIQKDTINNLEKSIELLLKQYEEKCNKIIDQSDTMLEAMRLGFCNNGELVKNGVAEKILEVVSKND